jgi:hypothetical protein
MSEIGMLRQKSRRVRRYLTLSHTTLRVIGLESEVVVAKPQLTLSAWLLRKLFFGVFQQLKFVRKLLNVRSQQALKIIEITALVPFSTATGVDTQKSRDAHQRLRLARSALTKPRTR